MIFDKTPDPGWLPLIEASLEGVYKVLLISVMGFLAYHIAVGRVEEATSYGLKEVVRILGVLAGGAQLSQYLGKKSASKE